MPENRPSVSHAASSSNLYAKFESEAKPSVRQYIDSRAGKMIKLLWVSQLSSLSRCTACRILRLSDVTTTNVAVRNQFLPHYNALQPVCGHRIHRPSSLERNPSVRSGIGKSEVFYSRSNSCLEGVAVLGAFRCGHLLVAL